MKYLLQKRRQFLQLSCAWCRYLQTVHTVQPMTRSLEQEKQACYLTKTLCRRGIPGSLHDHVDLTEVHRNELISSMKRCIIETNWFHLDDDGSFDKKMKRAIKDHVSAKLLLNLQRVIWTNEVASKSNLLHIHYAWRPGPVAPWERLGRQLQVSGKLGQLLCSKNLLPVFADQSEVEETRHENVEWNDVISPFFELPLNQSNFLPERGFHPGSPYPCPQTLLINSKTWWRPDLKTGQALFFSFAHALTYALEQGYKMGEDLKSPIPIQAVSFDGDSFFFVCFQLNTLNFEDRAADVKNIAWIESDHLLYERVTDQISDSEDFLDVGHKRLFLEGFNRNAAELFLTFMLNPLYKDD